MIILTCILWTMAVFPMAEALSSFQIPRRFVLNDHQEPFTFVLHPSKVSPGRTSATTLLRASHEEQEDDNIIYAFGQKPIEESIVSQGSMNDNDDDDNKEKQNRRRLRKRVMELAKTMVLTPISYASPLNVGAVLSDATLNAVDMAVDDLVARRSTHSQQQQQQDHTRGDPDTIKSEVKITQAKEVSTLIEDAFRPVEESLDQMETSLQDARVDDMKSSLKTARQALAQAKVHARQAMEQIQESVMVQALEGAVEVVEKAEKDASVKALADIYASAASGKSLDEDIIASLTFEDIDYGTSEMAPPFLDEESCLVPGEPVVRVEKAPENSRRIFAGIDIVASVDDVWNILTDYAHLQDVVPNLVTNQVLEEFAGTSNPETVEIDTSLSEALQCREMSKHCKGAILRQVGGAKVAGINFSARTTLEVREWPQGLPDFSHLLDDHPGKKLLQERANDYTQVKLQRYMFPRPFAVSSLPTRDITMQSVEDDDGEFRMYQGVWRMQPLPGCVPPGKSAMRLTYAVEVSPRAYLPVKLIEGRIARDLHCNLIAIRDFVAAKTGQKQATATA